MKLDRDVPVRRRRERRRIEPNLVARGERRDAESRGLASFTRARSEGNRPDRRRRECTRPGVLLDRRNGSPARRLDSEEDPLHDPSNRGVIGAERQDELGDLSARPGRHSLNEANRLSTLEPSIEGRDSSEAGTVEAIKGRAARDLDRRGSVRDAVECDAGRYCYRHGVRLRRP